MGYILSIFLIPLLAGFLILKSHPKIKYTSYTHNGYHLIMLTLLLGLAITLFAHISIEGGNKLLGTCSEKLAVEDNACDIVKSKLSSGWGVLRQAVDVEINNNTDTKNQLAITDHSLLGLILSGFIWAIYFFTENDEQIEEVLLKEGGPQEELIVHATRYGKIVIVTLKSRKVYIGFIYNIPSLSPLAERHITIAPLWSGYRTSEEHSLIIENNYAIFIHLLLEYPDGLPEGDSLELTLRNGETIVIDNDILENIGDSFGVVIGINDIESLSVWIPQVHRAITATDSEIPAPDTL